ncbi:hypothetical protein [Brevundimonas sp. NPDC058933]|uniref:hypothetical protein n=1 Tax=Brevundimonas sp. NPDC058933 TaxID=3346673 RepID=UPI003BEF1F51
MPNDPNRATFVQQEYRFEKAENLNIKATYQSSRELVLMTNLAKSAAAALASKLFAENNTPADAYNIEVEGVYAVSDFKSAPLRFTIDMPMYATSGRTFKVTSIEADPFYNRTTLELRG